MANNNNISKLFTFLKSKGQTNAKDVHEFATRVAGAGYRNNMYNNMRRQGADIGTVQDFNKYLGYTYSKNINKVHVPSYNKPQVPQNVSPYITGQPINSVQGAVNAQDNKINSALNEFDKKKGVGRLKQNVDKAYKAASIPSSKGYPVQTAAAQKYEQMSQPIQTDEQKYENYINKLQKENNIDRATAEQQYRSEMSKREGGGFVNSLMQMINKTADPFAYEEASRSNTEGGRKIIQADATDKQLSEARESIKEAKSENSGSNFVKNTAKGILKGAGDMSTWDFGLSDARNSTALLEAVNAYSSNKANKQQKRLVEATALNNLVSQNFGKQIGMWYKAGKISGQSLGFMAQMIADPISGLGSGAGKAATKLFLKGLANKIGRAGVAKLFAKTAVKKLGIDIGKGALMATVGSGTIRTVADTQQRRAGNAQYDSNGNVQITNREDAGTALAKAIWNQTGQNGTEFMGEHFGRIGKMLGKSVAKGIAGNVGEQAFRIGGKELQGVTLGSARKALYDIALGRGFGKVGEAVSKLNAKAKYNSGIGEYGEEVAGNVWNLGNGDTTLDTDENTGIFNLHNNLQTFLGVSLFGGVESAMKTGAYCMPASWNARIDLKNIDKQNAKLFGEEGWKSIKSKLDVAADSPTKLNELYEDIEDEKETGFDVKQREAIANYMGAQQKAIGSRGITLAMRPTSVDIDNDKGKFTVTATGKFGNVLKKRTFDNEDEANAEKDSILVTRNMNDARNLYAEAGKTTDSEQQRIAEDLINSTEDSADDINKKGTNLYNSYINSVADANSKKQEQIEQFEEENGLERGGLEDILSKNPLKLTREEEDITSRATDFLRGMILPPGSLHAEESAADAQQAADKDGIGSDNVNAVSVQTRVRSWDDAQNAYNALPEDVQQQVAQMQKNGNSNEEILDFVSENFNDTEKVLPVIADMMNADAAKNAYMQTAEDNINKQVEDTAKKLTFVGTVNGEQRPDTLQIVTDKTGKQCAVVSGNISAKKGSDLSEGNSVDVSSDSGVVILRDMETGNLIVSDGNDLTYNKEQPLEEFKQNAYEIQGQKTSDVIMPQTPEQQVVPSEPVQQGITVRDGDGNIHTPSDPVPTEGQIKVQNGNEPTKEEPTKQGTLVDKDGKHVGEMPSMKVDDTPTQSVEQEPIKQQAATQGNDTVDEDGNLIYDKAPVEDTLKDLRDGELSDNEVSDFIDANIAEAKSNFDKENKKAPKMSTNKKKYLAEKTAWKSIADEAKRKLDYWNSVKAANEEVVKQIAADKIAKEQAKQEPIKEQPIEQPKAEVKEEPKKAEEPIKEIPKEGTPKEEHIADTSKKIEPEEGNHLRDNTKKVKETLPVDKKEPTKDAVKEADKTRSEINEARKEVEKNPTEAQKEAGNYKKGHVNVDGYDITIENPKGSERSSKDKDGNEWSVKMNNDYGYIKGTEGVDGDHVDIFLSDFPNQGNVFVIDQVNPDGSFDEHKVMYGFDNMEDAKNAYLANYSKGWKGLGNISEVSKEEFKKWINSSTRKTKPFSEYKSVSTIGDVSKNGASIGNTAEDKADEYIKGSSNIAKRNSKEKTEFNDDYDTDYELSKLFGRVSNDYLEKMSKSENKVAREIALRELDLRKIENKFSQKFDEEFSKQEEIPETEAKSKKFNPYDYTEGDDKRPNFEGVYNDASGYGVVTDGYILLADKKLYDKKNKGKVIGKDGREIDGGKYPNWKSVIPHNRYYVDAVEKLSKKINSIESKMKANWKRAKDNNENPGSFAKYISNLNVCLKMPNGKVMVFRYDTLSKFINAAKELGTTKINFEFKGKPIVAKSKGGECIVMPVAYDSDAYSLLQMQSNHEGGILIDLSKEPSGENKIEKQADTTLDDLTNDTEAQKATTDTVVEALNNNKDVKVIVEDSNAVPDGAEKQSVFHGSGNKFDTFDFSHMGEGEGAQAYGWGGYVTEVEGIGKSYAKKMLSDKYSENRILNNLVRDGLKSNNGDKDKLLSYLESLMGENWSDKKRVRAEIRIIKRGKYLPEGTVSLYSVSIPDNTGNNYLGFTDIIGEDKANKIGIYLNKIGFSKTDSEIPTFENNGKRIIINPKAKGSDIYAELSEAFGTDKEASHILNEAGFIGIQYPAQYRSGGRSDDASNYIIFNEKDMKITNRVQFLKDSDGKVYGWAVGNEIHLTKDGLNPNTPIHEYTHLWAKAMMKANPKEWDNIKSMLKGTPVWEEVLNDKNYQDIKDNEDDVASEVLSRISGRENSKRIIDDMQKAINKAKGEGKVLDVARKTKVLNNIKNAIQKFWNWVGKDLFNIQFKSIDEVTDRVLYDLVEGTELKLTNDNDARYQFIGEKGAANADKAEEATTRLDNLQVARDMENSKKDAKTIKMATGWERGADGKWRYETSDIKIKKDADPKDMEMSGMWYQSKIKLYDFIEDKKLFDEYPDLKNINVVFKKMSDGAAGKYSPAFSYGPARIELSSEYLRNYFNSRYREENINVFNHMQSVLTHEVQHAIQFIEGFALDGTPNSSMSTAEYKRLSGEVESRNVQKRMDMTPEERRQSLAKETEDVSRKDQIFIYDSMQNNANVAENEDNSRKSDVRFRIDNSGTQYRADARRKIDEHISNIERKTGVKINRVANIGQTTGEVHDRIEKGDKVTGWYDQKTGEVNLYMPNINSVYEAERTVLHELSGHKGLREMFGTHYSEFMRSVWNNRNQELVDYVSAHLMENGGNLYKTIDEYLAEQAEKDATPIGFWAKICKLFTDVIHNIGYTFNPNINDVRFVIWQSNRFMRGKNSILDKARAIRMKQQLKDNPPVFVSINNRIYGDNISVGSNNLTKDQSDELDKVGLDSEYFSNYQNMENMSPEKFDEYTGEGLLYNDTPTTSFQKLHYESALKRISFVWKEAHVNSMQSAIELLKAITGKDVNDIDSNENFIWGENQMSSVGEAAGEKFVKNFLNPLSKIVGILAPSCGVDFKDGMSNLQLYMYKMSGLERNRVFFIRDFINSQKKLEDSDPNRKYTNDELDKLQSDWDDMKKKNDDELHDGKITVFDYFGNLDNFVCQNIDDKYIAGEHDYSALSQMEHGTGKSTYDDMAVIDDIANTESSFGVDFSDAHDKRNQLWDAVNNINNYCLTFSYECGLDSKDAHDHVAKMMRYYIPMRGFNDKEANDEYDYTLDDESSNRPYVGPAIMQAKGRNSSLADLNIMATMAMMANTAIVRGLRNKMVAQRFARMVRNHHKDVKEKDRLVSEVLTWYAKKKVGVDANGNDIYEKGSNGKDVYYEQNPLAELEDNIKKSSTSDAEAEDKIAKLPSDRIAKAISDFNDRMEKEKNAGNAFTKKGKKPNIDIIKLTDKQKSEHIITAMFNGEKSQFILNGNPRASMAINGELGFQRTNNWFMKNVGAINRFMAQWQTSYSPNFIIRNTQRDGFFALSNITINETMKYRQKWEKNYAKCAYLLGTGVRSKSWTKGGIGGKNLLVAYQNDNLNENKFIEKCFKEFIDNGGRTGIVTAKSQEEWNSDMLKEAKKIIDGPIRKGGKEAVQAIPKLIEQLNSRAELLARFSTYLTSRETGRSIGRSISDAKEVSTNFNRSGAGSKSATFKQSGSEYGEHLASINAHLAGYTSQALREFINYYNAGMQSLGMMTKNFDKHSVKTTAVFSMAILGGLIIPELNAWLIGNDDKKKKKIKDDPYSELPEWTRRDNICIYKGDGEFYTIALPIELRAFYGMGDVAAGYTLNPKLISDISAGEQIVSLASSLLPVDFMGTHSNALAALIPSALSPIVDVATNTKWTKMPIQREANYMNKLDYMPLWMREYGDPTVTTDISKWVNGHTNGTPDHNPNYKGWGDIISPSQVNYLVQQYAGGVGKSVMDLSNLYKEQTDPTHKFTLGGLVGSKYLPMANTQHTTSDGYSEYARTNTRFYNYKDEFDKIDAFVRTAKKEPHGENIMDYLKAQNLINKPEGARYYIMRHYMKLYNKYNKLKNRSKGTSKEDLYKGRILNLKLDAVADLDKIKD